MKGHVRRRGSTWTVYYDRARDPQTGKRRKSSKGPFATKREAQAWLTRALSDQQRGSFVEPSKVTLGQFLREEWLPGLDVRGLRPNTVSSYRQTVEKHVLRKDVASRQLQALGPADLNALYAALVGEKLSARTVRYVHMILRQALRDAERWGRLVRNPADLATPPAASAATRDAERARQTWSASELRTFLERVQDDRLYCLWLLLATTGMRRGEALGLRWRDVDFERSRLAVAQTLTNVGSELVTSTPKTHAGTRSIALDETTLEALRAHRRGQAQEQLACPDYQESGAGLVFRTASGAALSPNAVSLAFQHRVRASGLPRLRLHDVRHTFASLALAAGVSPKVVSERLGHSSVAFTLTVYSHSIPALDEAAAERVASLVFGS